MEKNNKSLLYSVLGGAIACFVCIAMIFLFPSNGTKKLNARDFLQVNSLININEIFNNDEIILGDTGCAETETYCSTGTKCSYQDADNRCCTTTTQTGVGPDDCTGGSWSNGTCTMFEDVGAQKTRCRRCSAGYTSNGSGGCTACSGGTYKSAEGNDSCVECDGVVNSTHTECTPNVCYCNADRTACAWTTTGSQTYPQRDTTKTTQTACLASTVRTCCRDTGTGYALGNVASSNCIGYPNNIITDAATCAAQSPYKCFCNSDKSSCSWAKTGSQSTPIVVDDEDHNTREKCISGTVRSCCYKQNGNYVYGNVNASQCLGFPDNVIDSQATCTALASCSIEAVNVSGFKHMSLSELEQVKFNISDSVCGSLVDVSKTNFNGPTETQNDKTDNYKPTTGNCVDGHIYGTIKGTSIKSNTITIRLMPDWSERTVKSVPKSTYDSNPHSANEANIAGKDVYYDQCTGLNSSNVYASCVQHYRGCGSPPDPSVHTYCCVNGDKSDYKWYENQSSTSCPDGYTIDETKKTKDSCAPSNPEKIPHCYLDDDGEPHWTSEPGASWKIVEGITSADNCKKEETPACYLTPDNEYKWGLYAKNDGYTLITSIIREEDCQKPKDNEACYKNDDNDYLWTSEPPAGYTKVEGVTKPEDCAPTENPACYLHGNEFVWGNYGRIMGYIKLEDVLKEEDCVAPDTDACYKGPDGKYVWGKYGNDPSYTIISSVTDPANCTNEVPVVPTASNVSKLVYVFMAILMACGIGFIYYSSVVRKNN